MVNLKMIAIVAIVALVAFGGSMLVLPLDMKVTAQGNATGNQTGNYTDPSMAESGNVSGIFDLP
jgi:hypothetical protein